MYLLSYYKSPQMIFFRWKQKIQFFPLSRLFRTNGCFGLRETTGKPSVGNAKKLPGRFAMTRWFLSSPNRKEKKKTQPRKAR